MQLVDGSILGEGCFWPYTKQGSKSGKYMKIFEVLFTFHPFFTFTSIFENKIINELQQPINQYSGHNQIWVQAGEFSCV